MLTHVELAHAARRAYDKVNLRGGWDMEANIELFEDTVCIAIRGSEIDARDWARNLAAFPWKFPTLPAMCPFGFGRGAERMLVAFSHELGPLVGTQPIYVTGHSMGGATAILLAEMLSYYKYNVRECVAFAAPRTGKRVLAVPTTIYDHYNDPICDVPFFWAHPVERVVLPDMSDGILQHSMDYYVRAMELKEG